MPIEGFPTPTNSVNPDTESSNAEAELHIRVGDVVIPVPNETTKLEAPYEPSTTGGDVPQELPIHLEEPETGAISDGMQNVPFNRRGLELKRKSEEG